MNLRGQVMYSLKWLAGVRIAGQAINWAITLVVIRLLAPSDYGLMALASIFIGFANLFRELGLYSAMVQKPDLTRRQIEQSFGILIVGNGLIAGILLAVAPVIAGFFGDPRLTEIIRVLAIQFPLASVGVVQDAMLSRRMAFKNTSLVNLAVMLTNGAVTLGLALSGAGVWALVWGSLAGALMQSVGLVAAARYWCRPRFSLEAMADMMRFGGFVTASRMLWYWYRQADKAIIGKFLGQAVLGQYAVAYQLASMPSEKFAGLMNQIGLAAYSSVQADRSAIQFYFCKTIRMVAFFSFPVFWGISSISPELVNVVLGQKWQPAILPLSLLSVVMPLRMIENAITRAYDAVGKPHITTGNNLITFLVMPPAFFVGVHWGLTGVSLAWLLAYPLVILARLARSLPALDLNFNHYFKSIAGPAIGGGIMYSGVTGVRLFVAAPYLSPVFGLVVLVTTGAALYALYMWWFHREQCLEVLQLVSNNENQSAPAG